MMDPARARLLPFFLVIAALAGCAGRFGGDRIDLHGLNLDSAATSEGFLVANAAGGEAGAALSRYFDAQAAVLAKAAPVAKVERVAEGIKITFASGSLFPAGATGLTDTGRVALDSLARHLGPERHVLVRIQAHTDSAEAAAGDPTGAQARSVASALERGGVAAERMVGAQGWGARSPVATNADTSGRVHNRRVEMALLGDGALRRKARRGEL